MNQLEQAAQQLLKSSYAVVLTGAGISVESGIPDFRSADGLWSRYDPAEYAAIESFLSHPAKVWKMLLEMDELLLRAAPNPAHFAVAELEDRGIVKAVVTQNVDSLHQRAGSKKVIEYHGHNRSLSCTDCGRRVARQEVSLAQVPPLCACGGPLRPDFVFFGEAIPSRAYQEANLAARRCDLLMVIGTSATVAPASYLPLIAKEHRAFILEINPSPTELSSSMTDLHVAEPAGEALPVIVEHLTRMSAS